MSRDQEENGVRGDYAEQSKHHCVNYLISSTKNHIVYLDQDGDIAWETTPQYDSDASQNSAYNLEKRNSILSDAALLEARPRDGLAEATRRDFKRLIGEALVRCLDFDYRGGQKRATATSLRRLIRHFPTSR